VPLLSLAKKWLDPHPSFTQRLLVGLRTSVTAHAVVKVLIKRALEDTPMVASSALGLQCAGIADLGADPVPLAPVAVVFVLETQGLPSSTDVVVALGIVAEVPGAEEPGVAEVEVGDRKISPDTGLLDGRDVLARAVSGVAGDVVEPKAPPKAVPQRRSSIGRFSVTSEGVTSTPKMTRALAPSTT
jgi:hypothetical protein